MHHERCRPSRRRAAESEYPAVKTGKVPQSPTGHLARKTLESSRYIVELLGLGRITSIRPQARCWGTLIEKNGREKVRMRAGNAIPIDKGDVRHHVVLILQGYENLNL